MSGAPAPDRWDAEISIDLGAVDAFPDPGEPPPPTPRRPWLGLPPGRENVLLAYAAIVITLVAAAVALVKVSPLSRPLAEKTVAAYLEAVHDGDVDAAMSYTNLDEPVGDFMVPEALDDSWRIVKVAQVEYSENRVAGAAVALVYAEIEAEDGTRAGYRYRVGLENGRAEIENALMTADAYAAFDHLAINGVTVPVDRETGFVEVMLLPGVYRFYPDLPSTLEPDTEPRILALGTQFTMFGEEYADPWLPVPWMHATEEGQAAVEAALRAHFDGCAAEPSLELCPFTLPADPDRDVALAPGGAWEITAYPQVQVQWWWYEEGEGFTVVATVPGEARAQVVIVEGGQARLATVSCPIWTDGLTADLDFEGGVTIGEGPDGVDEQCRSLVEVG
ncbi:hypothetical protein [Glycomyces harbinensis]|uniref:DUF4878 domain-containing protein n=1 Tax=Glycomyces harbinensis TaxID=58114 RepID=A0A1G7DGV1_9ACTN|nr:hypothetical protein [Glycomyces harbinensis]SDE50791.1 hypothetical protein SAMN05216270_12523 [Glycomyces harbinensis]